MKEQDLYEYTRKCGEWGFSVYDLLRSFKENLMSAAQIFRGEAFLQSCCLNCCLQNR